MGTQIKTFLQNAVRIFDMSGNIDAEYKTILQRRENRYANDPFATDMERVGSDLTNALKKLTAEAARVEERSKNCQ